MRTEVKDGVGGKWTTIHINFAGKEYRRITAPDGRRQYASIANGRANSIRVGGKKSDEIDAAIANAA